jgi:hypothetical protein
MFKKVFFPIALTVLVPTLALAVTTPTAFLESAQIIGTGTQLQAYRVPTKDQNGVTKYYDVTVTLNVLPNGTIGTTSAVASTLSPTLASNKFIPGTYKDPNGNVCTVAVSTLNGGRMQSALTCRLPNGYPLSATWITGPVPGHPFELDLRAAMIDKIPGYQNFSWGKVSSADALWWQCLNTSDIISATQVSNVIQITGYDRGNTQVCGTTLTKQ